MKIKLAILERDTNYLRRLVSTFGAKYADKLEIYSFTDPEMALSAISSSRIDVLLASDSFEINAAQLPKRCAFAYFVDSHDVETINNQRAICKFQKAELIYKQVLSLFAEKATNVSGIKVDDDSCSIIAFASAGGGVGSSSAAAACALSFASKGMKTLYLNLEKYGVSDQFFSAAGQFDMSDLIFAIKSKKSNLALKLESYVRRDPRGVSFFAGAKVALDVMELKSEDILRLLSELRLTGTYEVVILDIDFSLDNEMLKILRTLNAIVLVSDGSDICNSKTLRAIDALNIIEQHADAPLIRRISLFYNMFSNKTSSTLGSTEIREIGGAPRYQHASVQDVITTLAGMDAFGKIL